VTDEHVVGLDEHARAEERDSGIRRRVAGDGEKGLGHVDGSRKPDGSAYGEDDCSRARPLYRRAKRSRTAGHQVRHNEQIAATPRGRMCAEAHRAWKDGGAVAARLLGRAIARTGRGRATGHEGTREEEGRDTGPTD
jgi:hypothetical protein